MSCLFGGCKRVRKSMKREGIGDREKGIGER